MIRVFKYKLRLKYDGGGFVNILTMATNIAAAKRVVMLSEGCPEGAILSIRRLKGKLRM